MLAYGLTVTDVATALRQQNLELPGGRMNQGAQEFTVRTMGKITDAQAFKLVAVCARSGWKRCSRFCRRRGSTCRKPMQVSKKGGRAARSAPLALVTTVAS
jgi:hypothetical protein